MDFFTDLWILYANFWKGLDFFTFLDWVKKLCRDFYQAVDFLRPWIFYYMRRFDQVKDAKFEFIR